MSLRVGDLFDDTDRRRQGRRLTVLRVELAFAIVGNVSTRRKSRVSRRRLEDEQGYRRVPGQESGR